MVSDSPIFPSVRVLELFGSHGYISFDSIFSRFPHLQELSYDVRNSLVRPRGQQSALSCIRLHPAVSVVREWTTIENNFKLFHSPEFPRLQRLVLHGSWHQVVDHASFAPFRDGLRAQGCQLEFPEGQVLR